MNSFHLKGIRLPIPRSLDKIVTKLLHPFNPYISNRGNKEILLVNKYIIFAILIFLCLYWLFLSIYMYNIKIPFYDSASYQYSAIYLQELSQSHGIIGAIIEIWNQPSQSFLWKLFVALYASLFEINWNALIFFHITIQFVAIYSVYMIGNILRQDNYVTLAMIFLLLGVPMYGSTGGGILDQRLDMTSLAFTVLILTTGLRWRESLSLGHAILAGLALGAGILHRPILIILLFILLLVLFCVTAQLQWKGQRNRFFISALVYGGIAALSAGPIFLAHFDVIQEYYSRNWDNTSDGPISIAGTAARAMKYTVKSLGFGMVVIVAGLVLSWRHGGRDVAALRWILIAGLVTVGIPLTILGAVWNSLVFYPAAAVIILVPLLIDNDQEFGRKIIVGLLATGLIGMTVNIVRVGASIGLLSGRDRIASTQFLKDLRRHSGTQELLVLGGVTSLPFDSVILTMLARQEEISGMEAGPSYAHTFQYGLSDEGYRYSEDELARAIDCTLNGQIKSADYVITNDQPEFAPSYSFDNRFKPLINSRLQTYPDRFVDAGVFQKIQGVVVRAYQVRDRTPIPCLAPDPPR